jgi:hypothetical protein
MVAPNKGNSHAEAKERMMKVYKALLPLAAALVLMGCESRGKAESVIGQADKNLSGMRDQASSTAPAELKAAESTFAHMKQNFDAREYQAVLDEVPQFNAHIQTLHDAMTANQAAATEWASLNTAVPPSIEAIQARVAGLKPAALPKDVTKEELETARTELETLKTTWAEATAAAQAGKPVEAADKGRVVQAKAEELKNALGMNETLATATPASTG